MSVASAHFLVLLGIACGSQKRTVETFGHCWSDISNLLGARLVY